MPRAITFTIISLAVLAGCSQPNNDATPEAPSYEEQLRLQLETARAGDVIVIPVGVHNFSRSLTLNTNNVTIRGAGMDKSVLSFKGQIAGAEGLLVNASDPR